MVTINAELMRERRVQLGWTSEQLAEKSGLDPGTIRRMEQGKTRARLHTAVAVAQALTLDTSAFVLNDRPTFLSDDRWQAGRRDADMIKVQLGEEGPTVAAFMVPGSAFQRDANEDMVAAAFKAAADTFNTELTCEGDQSFREVMYVVSLLLTRALATEGKGLAKQEEEGGDEVVAAFKAADVAIRKTLSGRGDLSMEEAICVLSLLLTRFGIAFSRQPEHGPYAGFSMVDAISYQTKKALSDHPHPGYSDISVTIPDDSIPDEPLLSDVREGDIRIGKSVILRKPSR